MNPVNDSDAMKRLADNLWDYLEPKVKGLLTSGVSYYRAQTVSAATEDRISVQRPFDETVVSLPYVSSAAELPVGSQVTVLVLGDPSNAIILGNGTLSNL